MEHRRLGTMGLMVSELCLGCMTFGRELDEESSVSLISRFLEAGGNFIDTADVYADGASEQITGRAITGVRDEVVLATKVRFPMGEGPNELGLFPCLLRSVLREGTGSLGRAPPGCALVGVLPHRQLDFEKVHAPGAERGYEGAVAPTQEQQVGIVPQVVAEGKPRPTARGLRRHAPKA